ncbi:MAG: hypothetical protein SPJ13_04615 [Bacteroidales bacterium]|nr:hypothetical protein [Bacteroidales bacterium]
MKKIVIFLIVAFMATASFSAKAQIEGAAGDYPLLCKHCQQVTMDRYEKDNLMHVPPVKVAYWCSYSKMAFFVADEIPETAIVYNLTQVVNKRSGNPFPDDYVVSLDSMNYFAYNFGDFQRIEGNWGKTIYYRTPGSEHPFLGVRCEEDMSKGVDVQALVPYEALSNDYFTTKK